jgi:hypothetical protein
VLVRRCGIVHLLINVNLCLEMVNKALEGSHFFKTEDLTPGFLTQPVSWGGWGLSTHGNATSEEEFELLVVEITPHFEELASQQE